MGIIPFSEDIDRLKKLAPLLKLMGTEIHAISIYLSMEDNERWKEAYNEAKRYMNEWEKKIQK